MERATRSVWAARVARWEQSGLTAARFAAREGINPRTLSFWKWKLRQPPRRRRDRGTRDAGVKFVELLGTAPTAATLEVLLPLGYRIGVAPGFDAATLRTLLTVLEAAR